MSKTNWVRLILGALIAAIICFLSDGLFHEKLVSADWQAVYSNLGVAEPKHNALGVLYFALFDLGRGLIPMFIYVMMRPCCGAGPKTAAMAGVVGWIAFSVTGPAQFIPLGFYSNTLLIKVAGFQLVTSIIATIAGAAVYKDPRNA